MIQALEIVKEKLAWLAHVMRGTLVGKHHLAGSSSFECHYIILMLFLCSGDGPIPLNNYQYKPALQKRCVPDY